MRPFTFLRARDENQALAAGRVAGTRYLAGGTTLVDLMRLDVMRPERLVDVTSLPLAQVESTANGVRIGAMVRNTDLAYHPLVAQAYPVLREALLAGASPQIRNMATVGGNLLQRTRCSYFRDLASPCNKRDPESGCGAIGGYSRMHAVLGGSDRCIAVHPSDMCVALAALDAVVVARKPDGTVRRIAMEGFHTIPGDEPQVENVLGAGDLVTHVELSRAPVFARSHYVKVRDRSSFAFALASAAVGLDVEGGIIREARVALGGIATKPWRSRDAERVLRGSAPTLDVYASAAEAALAGAVARGENAYKIELGRRTLVRALRELVGSR